MNSNSITVSNLTKKFSFSARNASSGWLKNLFSPETKEIVAVNDISFSVKHGERIAFIGPNGAGKSTTIKMLTGILFPTSGEVNILGLNPVKDRKKLAYQIGTVFGQRSQLLPNLPLTDSLEFFGVMYDLKEKQIKKRIEELTELFGHHLTVACLTAKISAGVRARLEIRIQSIRPPKELSAALPKCSWAPMTNGLASY